MKKAQPKSGIYEKLHCFESIEHNGRRYPAAIEFESSVHKTARHPVEYEYNNAGEMLYALPGGGRATAKQIRGLA